MWRKFFILHFSKSIVRCRGHDSGSDMGPDKDNNLLGLKKKKFKIQGLPFGVEEPLQGVHLRTQLGAGPTQGHVIQGNNYKFFKYCKGNIQYFAVKISRIQLQHRD